MREDGGLPARLLGRGARPRRRGAAARARRVRRRVDPAVQLHGHAGADPGEHHVGARDERARRLGTRAHDLRDRRDRRDACRRTASRPRWTRRSGRTPATCSSGAGTRCRPRRTCGASCSTRASQGARLVVVDPFRSRTARLADEHLRPLPGTDAALAIGMMRAIVDAGLHDEDWCRAHADGYDELLARARTARASRSAPRSAGWTRRRSRAWDASSPPRGPRCCGSAWAPSATPARRPPTRRSHRCPLLTGAWKDRGGGCSYIPTRHRRGDQRRTCSSARTCARAPVRTINMSRLGEALTDPAIDPPVKALVCWSSNPASIAPDQERVLEGLRRDDLFTVVLEQFMTDTAQHADVVLPATTQLEHLDVLFSWGHHYVTWNEPAIEPRGRGEAEHRDVPPAGRAARPRRSVLPRTATPSWSTRCSTASRRTACASAAGRRWTSARGRCRTRTAASAPRPAAWRCTRATSRPPRWPTRAGRALPARAGHAEDASVPQLDLREPAPPALGAAGARGGGEPGGRRRRAASRTAWRCACSTTAARSMRRARVRRRPPRRARGARWAGGTATTRAAAARQATTPQLLTAEGNAPTFNDNRVECERLKGSDPLVSTTKGSDPYRIRP